MKQKCWLNSKQSEKSKWLDYFEYLIVALCFWFKLTKWGKNDLVFHHMTLESILLCWCCLKHIQGHNFYFQGVLLQDQNQKNQYFWFLWLFEYFSLSFQILVRQHKQKTNIFRINQKNQYLWFLWFFEYFFLSLKWLIRQHIQKTNIFQK